MPGFESCCLTSRRELRCRLFIVVLLALAALAASQFWGRYRSSGGENEAGERVEALERPIEKALDDLADLGVGPDGEALRPEDIVAEAQKALAQGLEARP